MPLYIKWPEDHQKGGCIGMYLVTKEGDTLWLPDNVDPTIPSISKGLSGGELLLTDEELGKLLIAYGKKKGIIK